MQVFRGLAAEHSSAILEPSADGRFSGTLPAFAHKGIQAPALVGSCRRPYDDNSNYAGDFHADATHPVLTLGP